MIDRIAISSIAWRPDEFEAVLRRLVEAGVRGIEIAPTMVWANPATVRAREAIEVRRRWSDLGLEVVAFQSLLFGRPKLQLFGDERARDQLKAHLRLMSRLAGWLGAPVMVFGSPRNRGTFGRPAADVRDTAVSFFRSVASVAVDFGTAICVEPNPAAYGTDFVTDMRSALDLVREVDAPGFGIHIDTGAALIDGPIIADDLEAAAHVARHVHLSEPNLAEFGASGDAHRWISAILRRTAYARWLSIEMTAPPDGPSLPRIERALAAARRLYG